VKGEGVKKVGGCGREGREGRGSDLQGEGLWEGEGALMTKMIWMGVLWSN
jgi:hypothetical protein